MEKRASARPQAASALLVTATSFVDGATARVAVTGAVDLATEAQLRDTLLAVLARGPLTALEVDLRHVYFLDSCGIRALTQARNAAVAAGCAIWVTNPAPIVLRVLEVTGLAEVFSPPFATTGPASQPEV